MSFYRTYAIFSSISPSILKLRCRNFAKRNNCNDRRLDVHIQSSPFLLHSQFLWFDYFDDLWAQREKYWKEKSIIFCTPQLLKNDIKEGRCDPKSIILLIVDEAHRAQGILVSFLSPSLIANRELFVLPSRQTNRGCLSLFSRHWLDSYSRIQHADHSEGLLPHFFSGIFDFANRQVIGNLLISRLDVRHEEAIDVKKYIKTKTLQIVLSFFALSRYSFVGPGVILLMSQEAVDLDDTLKKALDLFYRVARDPIDALVNGKVFYSRDIQTVLPLLLTREYFCLFIRCESKCTTDGRCQKGRSSWLKKPFARSHLQTSPTIYDILFSDTSFALPFNATLIFQFGAALSLFHAKALLEGQGLISFTNAINKFCEKEGKVLFSFFPEMNWRTPHSDIQVSQAHKDLVQLDAMKTLRSFLANVGGGSQVSRTHPKMKRMKSILVEHFRKFGTVFLLTVLSSLTLQSTRAIVFTEYRDTVGQIVSFLQEDDEKEFEDASLLLKPHEFVGQASSGVSDGIVFSFHVLLITDRSHDASLTHHLPLIHQG